MPRRRAPGTGGAGGGGPGGGRVPPAGPAAGGAARARRGVGWGRGPLPRPPPPPPAGAAVAADRPEQPLRLGRGGPRGGGLFPVEQQQGRGDAVGVAERRDLVVDRGRLPEAAPFGLEPERGQRAVVGAAAGDPRGE